MRSGRRRLDVVLDANFLHVNDLSFSLVSEPWGLLERCDNQRVRSRNFNPGLAATRRSNAHGDFLARLLISR
jgi:hypothetical protein